MISVSAVITTHNRKDLLCYAIRSVLSQTYKNIECIVVDDASTDGTREYCESLSEITYIPIEQKDSKGGNYARNVGVESSHGEYIAFLDDDDEWLPDKIEKQMNLISSDVEFVYCGRLIEYIDNRGICVVKDYPKYGAKGDMSKKILSRIYCVTSEILVKRQLLIDVGLFDIDIKFWQEYELCIRLFQHTKVDFVNECLIKYRASNVDNNRLTNKYYSWLDAVRLIEKKHSSLYDKLDNLSKMKHRLRLFSESSSRILNSNSKQLICEHIFQIMFYYIFLFPVKNIRRRF